MGVKPWSEQVKTMPGPAGPLQHFPHEGVEPAVKVGEHIIVAAAGTRIIEEVVQPIGFGNGRDENCYG